MAQDFAQANAALALAGTDDDAAHVAAWMLNAVTGNIGKTVNLTAPAHTVRPLPATGGALLEAMRAGDIKVAVIAETNRMFSMPSRARISPRR